MLEGIFGDWLTDALSGLMGEEGGLVQTIVAGVATSVILETFRSLRKGRGQSQSQAIAEPAQGRRGSWFSRFLRRVFVLSLAIIGGVAIAIYGGRYLLDIGLVERPFPLTRLGLLIGGTILCYSFLSLFRRR